MRRGDDPPVRLWRLLWLMFLLGQGVLATAWWWLSAGGFGLGHRRFWLNQVAAPAVAVGAIVTLAALRRERWGPLRLLLPAWPAAWAGMAVALRLVFPVSMARLWLVPMGIAVATGLVAVRPWRMGSTGAGRLRLLAVVVAGAAVVGAAMAAAFRPPPAGTRPRDLALLIEGASGTTAAARVQPGSVRVDADVMIQTSDGSLMARFAPLTISAEPLLRFQSRSPDGAPVVLIPAGERSGPEPRFRDGRRVGDRWVQLVYDVPGQGPATLRAGTDSRDGAILVEAASRLDRPVFSHLNGFCDVEVRGHRRLTLEFSPCPGVPIEVRRFGYPSGRPARFAYVAADRTFRVVEAASGEKGPFRTLAAGRLDSEQSLTITFHDEDRAVARLTLDDFAAQADTTLSPTAGWGVPVNAIEFSLADDAPAAPASIFITLAGTSVGRGWDCVGHRAGTYRNRIRLESVGPDLQRSIRRREIPRDGKSVEP